MPDRRNDKMKLGAFFHPTGNHIAAWLHSGSQIDAGTNFEHYAALAQTAEAAKFDLMFLADAVATRNGRLNALKRWPQYMAYFDPMVLLSGIAARTSRLGLVATATTSYNEPYHVARRYASLDHLSHGRAGWNAVTSSNHSESRNFGREEHLSHREKYERALEFLEVVKGLWDSWEDDAFRRDRTTAEYFDPAKLHPLNHKGAHFSVAGPLNVARPPQGHPIIAQAGGSDDFIDMAGRHADLIFTAQFDLESAQALYGKLAAAVKKHGRPAGSLKVMPGLNAIVGRTEKEAQEKHEHLSSLIHPDVGREVLSNDLGNVDLSGVPLDAPIPEEIVEEQLRFWLRFMKEATGKENPTLRETYRHYGSARGQRPLVGTASQIADEMERWFQGRGADGFLIHPATLPDGLEDICGLLIPELQNRGLFRTEYEGETLRENLGLPRPKNRYA
ncbi:MAG TPA: LLM class flavin-dependent oxidoreductase [Hypericibacter adhaerens]|uniref:LLM class flavin-dependent oxidoreductase n=1 Tax=Hypericibacter adhaerens TaxID=2602016 RepID=UPI002CFD7D7A|nr:LLM class flavin-dependent oxidoreductase [Hypericibacter adhaerens]HWA45446.1 LLM class flavin-dependent oxidoreductase [Hypericibacter adhaerens]